MNLYKTFKFIAMFFSIIVFIVLLLFIVGEKKNPGNLFDFSTREFIAFIFFPIGVMIGMIISWWRQLTGALVTIISFLIFYFVYYLMWGNLPGGVWFLVFISPAFLSLIAGVMKRRIHQKND